MKFRPGGYPVTVERAARPGETVFVTVRAGGGSILPNLAGYQCEEAWFEVLGPTGWAAVPATAPACAALGLAPQVGAWPVAIVPAPQQPGTYRLVLRATTPAGGQQLIACDPFLVG